MKQNFYKICILTLLSLGLMPQSVFAQGVTTASMTGIVTGEMVTAERVDELGESLPGATVVAIHLLSGTQYGSSTNVDGRFNMVNMKVGGPYMITVSYIGYKTHEETDIYLALGEKRAFSFKLKLESNSLDEVIVTAKGSEVINSARTGAATAISKEQVKALPTISRGFNDFTRLTPQADIKGNSISIGGMNNRYNQVTIDGAVSNDVFGLSDSGTNGGATGTSPISLDAIEEFQVVVAPYDVRYGGFAGGGISAITKSGTNDISGSAYLFTRNEKLAGITPTKDPLVDRAKYDQFSDNQFGFRVGGAIIKDKLFYFVNAEKTNNVTPLSFAPGNAESQITVDEVARIAARAKVLGYDPGSYSTQESTNSSQKFFVRFDYNINDNHKITLRHSYTFGEAVQLSRSPLGLTFSNGGILRESKTNSTVLEVNSRFGNNAANNLVIGRSSVREPRTAPGAPFPSVFIDLGTNRSVRLGTEAFSTVNLLEQDILTITDNFNYFWGKHTFTLGTHNEIYQMYNAFIGQAFGDYRFNSIDDWEAGLASSFTYQYSKTSNPKEGANFGAAQIGVYAQDEFQALPNLRLTFGIRLDIPIYLDEPLVNDDFNSSTIATSRGLKHNEMPKPALMFSPRLGFNYDVFDNKKTQIRGGVGRFTSRFPFVWAGGAFTQNGILLDRNQLTVPSGDPANINFIADPNNQPKRAAASGPGGNITVIDPNFRLPQIFRVNGAIDQVLPGGIVATLEYMYAKNLNAFRFTNLNLIEPTSTLGGADNRPLYPSALNDRRILQNYAEVIYIDNVNAGGASSFTAQVQKTFSNGFFGSFAYTHTNSTDLFPGTSSQNHSNFYRVTSVNGSNNAEVATSPYATKNRFVGAVSYRKEYLKMLGTSVSLFYTGQSGTPFSYVYNGDLNRESNSGNERYDLIYVPNSPSEIQFVDLVSGGQVVATAAEQSADFFAYIEQDEYLRSRKGQYAERNGARTPFTHQFDLKIAQDIFSNLGGKRNTLQLTLDIFNVGNLINKDWGFRYSYGNSYFDNTYQLLRVRGYDATNTPSFTFEPVVNNEPWTLSDSPIGGSRWVGQIGIRYIFN